MNKDMARRLMRARRRASQARRPKPAPHPNDVRRPLDTWSPRDIERLQQDMGEEEADTSRPWGLRPSVPEAPAELPVTEQPKEKLSKQRTTKLTIAMSKEEEAIIKAFVSAQGRSISAWGREVLFAAMGKKMPPRH